MFSETKKQLAELKAPLHELRDSLDLASKEARIAELEQMIQDPTFWDDPDEAQKIMQELNGLKEKERSYQDLYSRYEDLQVLQELGAEENDESILEELEKGIVSIKAELEQWHLALLLNGPYDRNNALLSLHAGAGGTEAMDWNDMLMRMYIRWSEAQGYKVKVLDYLAGEEAGTKSATLSITGENAYGYLKGEMGVHRLVRLSPFDASGRRHTSFASVEVLPEVSDDIDIQINSEDLKVDTYRAGGAGGQHVNKTDSAVRITHLPTGIIVACQNERSQIQNKAMAMKMLQAKLFERERQKQAEEYNKLKGDQQDIAFGSQIRSYVFHPYNMVKDHRTNAEVGNVHGVMDGDLETFISSYLLWASKQ
ncbi:peptide chain release factor 2 [Heliorestis acidaminivorans]|uniref:Peptide chain release factor 2 n=1 Tax=Heliorestis acidaminivorans TaxID=553427 RepID=A0A6I0ETU0_9FIRM|nr:peptide chain release factor 2 [Heliorestis acidaminivorans]KAB2953604.1 peptide chain release factor 2 [Heliorestis acidaminivorans]